MSLKCSIFGHRFGEPVVDRRREEAGSEVVITIRETQTCTRCGEERTVSENKEVTTLETADDPADPRSAPEPESQPNEPTTAAEAELTRAPDPEQDDATIIEESPERSIVDESLVEEAEPDAGSAGGAVGLGDETDPARDDGVILDDEPEAPDERAPGEWPEEPGERDDEPTWAPETELDSDTLAESGPTVEPAREAVTVPEGIFHCPECGFSTPVESSSLREGDFCPECHTGALDHRTDGA